MLLHSRLKCVDEPSGHYWGMPKPPTKLPESLQTIRSVEFPPARRGYRFEDVDAFLERVAADCEEFGAAAWLAVESLYRMAELLGVPVSPAPMQDFGLSSAAVRSLSSAVVKALQEKLAAPASDEEGNKGEAGRSTPALVCAECAAYVSDITLHSLWHSEDED